LSELSLAQVDLEEVLHRLALHARHLITAARCLGVDDLELPGGDSPVDLASATLLKFLDPRDASVIWSESKGQPTTAGLLAFLRVVLERDFLNLVRSKRYRDTFYPDRNEQVFEPQGVEGDWFDSLPANSPGPEHEAMSHKVTAWLLEQFRGEPDLEAILRFQLEMDGYNAFTNLELARMLAVPVTEIENRKRRLKTRLNNLASGRQMRRAKHG
jgi:DNA-directed RNA polymerase specialized sigma24 family protein